MDAITPQMTGTLLVVDPDRAGRVLLQAELTRAGWEVLIAERGDRGLQIAASRVVDVAVVDLRLADLHGVDVLEQVHAIRPGLPVIAVAAAATVELAVEAMRAGAVDFVPKPCDCRVLQEKVCRWATVRQADHQAVVRLGGCASMVPAVGAVLREAGRLAACDVPMAICGAPGTGRKYLAAAMHQASPRKGGLHIVDASLISAEQFRTRLIQATDVAGSQGAVLIGELQQLKAPDQEFLGRLLAGDPCSNPRFYITLSDVPARLPGPGRLAKAIAETVNSSLLVLPPLVARREDISLLAKAIVAGVAPGGAQAIAPAALHRLAEYDWPGNVRQLRLVLERAARMAAPGAIEVRHLPILQAVHREPVPAGWTAAGPLNLQEIVENIERQLIESALSQTCRNQAKAAELLGIPRTTLRDKLEKYGFTPRARADQASK
jgi:DNA-binding NtrC family response regulator